MTDLDIRSPKIFSFARNKTRATLYRRVHHTQRRDGISAECVRARVLSRSASNSRATRRVTSVVGLKRGVIRYDAISGGERTRRAHLPQDRARSLSRGRRLRPRRETGLRPRASSGRSTASDRERIEILTEAKSARRARRERRAFEGERGRRGALAKKPLTTRCNRERDLFSALRRAVFTKRAASFSYPSYVCTYVSSSNGVNGGRAYGENWRSANVLVFSYFAIFGDI